jgi:glycosyltransferase involved in cell wall biosynthesis
MGPCSIAMIVSGFPRPSETFALNELLALDAQGILAGIFATKPGDTSLLHPDCHDILRRVVYLPESSPEIQSEFVVECLKDQYVSGVHGYFAHRPAEVASLVSQRLSIPYGFSTHALDARKVPEKALRERVLNAACIIACNHDVANDISRHGGSVKQMPHGVDINRFGQSSWSLEEPVQLLAVGRLVEKKGFDTLIKAVSQVSFRFHLKIIGEGPDRERLTRDISAAGLSDRVELCGGMTHAELPDEYKKAHIVIVPSIVNRAGDRDGLPNVVLEAMASARPIIASDVGAISSAIIDGQTGLLLPPGDSVALKNGLNTLVHSSELCEKLRHNARKRIVQDFELSTCTERFCTFLKTVYT